MSRLSSDQYYRRALEGKIIEGRLDEQNRVILGNEFVWHIEQRPFYNVYPTVTNALKNTSLKLRSSQIGEFKRTTICFAHGHEPRVSGGQISVTAMLVSVNAHVKDPDSGETIRSQGISIIVNARNKDGRRAMNLMQEHGDEMLDDFVEDNLDCRYLLSLAVGIILIGSDPRFAEPILLQRDVGKTFATPEDKQRAIDRAIRNGRNGMTIGKDIEVSPHCRRPHFGIRWTEKGHSVPRLVPVNGCLVNRSKLFPIPTGYLGTEENSANPELTS